MKKYKILLHIDYTDDTGKFYNDSCIKNTIFTTEKNIHETIANAMLEIDYMEVMYEGKPQANVYKDGKDGNPQAVGYIYRVKTDIEGETAKFDAWVTIKSVEDYSIKELI